MGRKKGYRHSEETKQKMSKAHKGKKHPISEETRRKISEALKGNQIWLGKHHSKEAKRKISQSRKGTIPWNKGYGAYMSGSKNHFYGKQHTEETKRKISEAGKGRVSWNRGLTKESDARVKKISQTLQGHLVSEETKEKLRQATLGRPSPRLGKRHSKESRLKMSESHKGIKPVLKGFSYEEFFGIEKTNAIKRKISETLKRRNLNGEIKGHYGGLHHQSLVKQVAQQLDDGINIIEIEKPVSIGKTWRTIDVLVNNKICYEIGGCRREKREDLIAHGYTVIHLPYCHFEENLSEVANEARRERNSA